jgi:hypothetical protein
LGAKAPLREKERKRKNAQKMGENAKNYAKYLTKRVKYAIISVLMSVFKFATKPFGI